MNLLTELLSYLDLDLEGRLYCFWEEDESIWVGKKILEAIKPPQKNFFFSKVINQRLCT